MRMVNLGPWEKNPKYCRGCYQDIDANHGGAEVELSMLFADVRGSTGLAERMTPRDFSDLLNRFYKAATQVLVEREAIVDKFVGDEVVGLFVPGMSGLDHARKAVDAAVALLEATGQASGDRAWIPVGVGGPHWHCVRRLRGGCGRDRLHGPGRPREHGRSSGFGRRCRRDPRHNGCRPRGWARRHV
jgi:hypothetical protein